MPLEWGDRYVSSGAKQEVQHKNCNSPARAAKTTSILDGSILKNTPEKRVIKYIDENVFCLKDKRVLMASTVDRYGMALAFNDAGQNIKKHISDNLKFYI